MSTNYKRLLTVVICIGWGMLTTTLMFAHGNLLGHPKEPNILGIICMLSNAFTIRIVTELDLLSGSSQSAAITMAMLIQFFVYVIIGIIISCVLYPPWKKESSKKAESHDEATVTGGQD